MGFEIGNTTYPSPRRQAGFQITTCLCYMNTNHSWVRQGYQTFKNTKQQILSSQMCLHVYTND